MNLKSFVKIQLPSCSNEISEKSYAICVNPLLKIYKFAICFFNILKSCIFFQIINKCFSPTHLYNGNLYKNEYKISVFEIKIILCVCYEE